MEREEQDRRLSGRAGVLAGLGVVALAAIVLGTVIVRDMLPGGRAVFDQNLYHVMAVREFAKQWPNFDLVNYRSATSPGYHLALAAVARFVRDDLTTLRIAGAVFTLGLLGTLAVSVGRRCGGALTAALLLPVAASVYVFGPGVFVLPDNAAWWGVLGVLLIALDSRAGLKKLALAGVVLMLLVWARQIHVWAAGVVWFAGWMGASGSLWPGRSSVRVADGAVGDEWRDRVVRAAVAVAFTLPAWVTLEYFVRSWHGLVPPLFQGGAYDAVRGKNAPNTTGGNLATPAFVLTLVGMFGVFFLGSFWPAVRRVLARERAALIGVAVGALVGLVLALVPRTFASFEAGRYSGFWTIAQRLPTVAGRSVFITGGAVAGGALLGLVWSALPRRAAWVLIVSLIGFTAAQTATFFAWQRYLEPMVLMVLVLAASRAIGERGGAGRVGVIRVVGPVVLAGILGAITFSELRQSPTIAADQGPGQTAGEAPGGRAEPSAPSER